MPNPVVHFEIQSSDPQKSREFFSEVFGWNITDAPVEGGMTYGIVDTQSDGVGIGGGIGPSMGGSHAAFYIAVDDIQASLDAAVAAGATVMMPITTVTEGITIAFFLEPTGAPVGLVLNDMDLQGGGE